MHTEGPWKEDDKHTGGARAIIGDGQQLVALIYGKTLEEQEANARLICDVLPPSSALDFSDFTAPTINEKWDPNPQELIYTALNHVSGDYEDADEDAALQIIERLVALVRRQDLRMHGQEPCDVCGLEVDTRADACSHCG